LCGHAKRRVLPALVRRRRFQERIQEELGDGDPACLALAPPAFHGLGAREDASALRVKVSPRPRARLAYACAAAFEEGKQESPLGLHPFQEGERVGVRRRRLFRLIGHGQVDALVSDRVGLTPA
jgi:hypothetical protein